MYCWAMFLLIFTGSGAFGAGPAVRQALRRTEQDGDGPDAGRGLTAAACDPDGARTREASAMRGGAVVAGLTVIGRLDMAAGVDAG